MNTQSASWPYKLECRQVIDDPNTPKSVREVLRTFDADKYRYPDGLHLVHKTAGYRSAGSAAIWHNEGWGVIFYKNDSTHGQWFKTFGEAENLFAKWTAQED